MHCWQADFWARLAGILASVKGTKRKEKEPRKGSVSEERYRRENTSSPGFQRFARIHSLEYKHIKVIGPLHSRKSSPPYLAYNTPLAYFGLNKGGGRAGMEGNRGGPGIPIPKFLQKLFHPYHTIANELELSSYKTWSKWGKVRENTGLYRLLLGKNVILESCIKFFA